MVVQGEATEAADLPNANKHKSNLQGQKKALAFKVSHVLLSILLLWLL